MKMIPEEIKTPEAFEHYMKIRHSYLQDIASWDGIESLDDIDAKYDEHYMAKYIPATPFSIRVSRNIKDRYVAIYTRKNIITILERHLKGLVNLNDLRDWVIMLNETMSVQPEDSAAGGAIASLWAKEGNPDEEDTLDLIQYLKNPNSK